MRIVPATLSEANAYVEQHHRHNGMLPSAKFACALIDDAGVVHGVAIAGLPKARMLMERDALEVNRVCTDGARNGCSMLYSACVRAGKALGYRRFVTYTLQREDGVSLRASGWKAVAEWDGGKWARINRPHTDDDRHDTGPKVRWEIVVGTACPALLIWPAVNSPQAGLF